MQISKRQADEIIDYLKSVVHEDINFIAPDGTIIASSDATRVGDFHGGAVQVTRDLKPLYIYDDNAYEGARKGINLPIFHERNLVAIVGITGDIETITQFSNVIVKMSEVLIKENFLNSQKQFKRENNRIIMELITKDKFNPEILKVKMDELSYNPERYHYFLISELENFDVYNIELSNLIYNSIEKRINVEDILTRIGTKFLLLSQIDDYEILSESFKTIKSYVENKYKVSITTGISEAFNDIENVFTAYKQANMVVDSEVYKHSGEIVLFDGSSIEFLFDSITKPETMEFPSRILGNIKPKDIKDIRELITMYIQKNGSINAVSEALFIHKNTVQYRLNKINELTGYNPRDLEDLISLFIALKLLD